MPQPGADQTRSAILKAGWRIIPLLGIGYLFAYIDRVNVSFAATQMNVDLGFSATVYGLGAGLFYLSYSLVEIPSNMLLVRFGPRRWLARIMIIWGILGAGMMLVRTPTHFYVMRFLLGLAEAGFFPGVIYYLSLWFPPRQRGRAIALFFLSQPLSVAVMGLVSLPLLGLDGTAGLRGWQWLFLVQGLPAALMGFAVLVFLPDSPATARWLSPGEKAGLSAALDDHPTVADGHGAHGLLSILADRRVQLMAAIYVVALASSTTFTLSGPAILMEITEWNLPSVSKLIMWGGLLNVLTMVLAGWISDLRGERFSALLLALTVDTLGYLAMVLVPDPVVVVVAFIVIQGAKGVQAAAQATLWTEVLHGRRMAIGLAAISTAANLGTFLMPLAFGAARDATGSYSAGLMVYPLLHGLALTFAVLLYRNVRGRRAAKPAAE